MARENEISSFLQYIFKYKQHYLDRFNIDLINNLLSNYGLREEELKLDYKAFTSYFEEFYRTNNSLNIYSNYSDDGYLVFSNIKYSDVKENNVNIYLNINPHSFHLVLTKILNYLKENFQIKHRTKVSIKPKSDQIEIKLNNLDDVKKVINFLNSSEDITSNMRYTNPFMYRCGIIGVTYDHNLEFNKVCSYLIFKYMLHKESINSISTSDFINFVKSYFNMLIDTNNPDEFNKFINSDMFRNDYTRIIKGSNEHKYIQQIINNYFIIFEEIIKLSNKDNDFNSFCDLYLFSTNIDENNKREDFIRNIIEKYRYQENLVNVKKQVVDDYIKYDYYKYKSADEVSKRLTNYANSKITYRADAINYITRDKGFREKFINIEPEDIYQITNNDIYGYVDKIVSLSNNEEVLL